jgi:hypothetical protein
VRVERALPLEVGATTCLSPTTCLSIAAVRLFEGEGLVWYRVAQHWLVTGDSPEKGGRL